MVLTRCPSPRIGTDTPECPFLGEGADLIMGAMSNYNSGLNPDGTFTGCDIVAQVGAQA